MKLYIWSGFPGPATLQAISLATDIDQARQQVFSSLNTHDYPELVEFIQSHEPRIYENQTGWLQEIGAQYI